MASDYTPPGAVRDKLAESLEAKKLWRRAANRWQHLASVAETDNQREWLIRRCNACVSRANSSIDTWITSAF